MRKVVTDIGTTLCKLVYGTNGTIEEVELIIENKWVTYGIFIWFFENLLMWAARVGVL